jgi:hypothetical protein
MDDVPKKMDEDARQRRNSPLNDRMQFRLPRPTRRRIEDAAGGVGAGAWVRAACEERLAREGR